MYFLLLAVFIRDLNYLLVHEMNLRYIEYVINILVRFEIKIKFQIKLARFINDEHAQMQAKKTFNDIIIMIILKYLKKGFIGSIQHACF